MGNGPRIQFSDSDRRTICELHKANPTFSHEKGLAIFMTENPQFISRDQMQLVWTHRDNTPGHACAYKLNAIYNLSLLLYSAQMGKCQKRQEFGECTGE